MFSSTFGVRPSLAGPRGPRLPREGSRPSLAGRAPLRLRAEGEDAQSSAPAPGPAERSLPRRAFDFGWPLALVFAASRQMPIGDVKVQKSNEEWKAILPKEAYHVLVERGTEFAGSSPLDKEYSPGVYECAACHTPLFPSETKFNSGTGWPSFYDPYPGAVDLTLQLLYCIGDFGAREVRCHTCGGHLGHMFTDGPKETTGKRYCMNGVAMEFKPKPE